MPPPQSTHDSQEPTHDETVIKVVTSNPEQQHYIAIGPRSASKRRAPILVAALLLLLVGIGAYSFSSGKSPVSTSKASLAAIVPAQVAITKTGFVPATLSIKVGQAVTWVNADAQPHVVASDPYPTDNTLVGFDSKQDLSTNDRFSFVFDKAGTYTYHDDLNPYTVQGAVIVKP